MDTAGVRVHSGPWCNVQAPVLGSRVSGTLPTMQHFSLSPSESGSGRGSRGVYRGAVIGADNGVGVDIGADTGAGAVIGACLKLLAGKTIHTLPGPPSWKDIHGNLHPSCRK